MTPAAMDESCAYEYDAVAANDQSATLSGPQQSRP